MTPFLVAAFYLWAGISCQAALTELDTYSLQEFDKLVRQRLLFMVVDHINDSISAQRQMQNDCISLVNHTVDNCQSCKVHLFLDGNPLEQVIPIVYESAVSALELLNDIANTVATPESIEFLGKQATKLANDIGSVAENVGNSLLGGAESALYSSIGGLKDFGDTVTSLTSTIGNTLNSLAGSLDHVVTDQIEGSLSHVGSGVVTGVKDTWNNIASGATDVANSLSSGVKGAVSTIGGGISSIGHSLSHVFGRKRSACSDCDKINSSNITEIIFNVCGPGFIRRQKNVLDKILHMRDVYSAAVNSTIIQKVEYDPTSIDVTHGVQFQVAFITYTINGQSRRYRLALPFRLTDLQTTSWGATVEIWTSYV